MLIESVDVEEVMLAKHQIMFPLIIALCQIALWSNAESPTTAPSSQPTSRPAIVVANLSPKDAPIVEAAIRKSLSGVAADETAFVSLGVLGHWEDPSPEFLQRLDDLKLKLRPVSAARHPQRGERESTNRYRGIEDPDTGKRSYVHWAQVKEWLSDTKVRVDVGVWSGPLGGGGSTDIYELQGGKWQHTGSEDHWVS